MSDEIIKKLAEVFTNQNKVLQKLAQLDLSNLPPSEPDSQKKDLDKILDELNLIQRSINNQSDIPEETRKHYVHKLNGLYNAIVMLYQ